MPTTTINGFELHYEDRGNGSVPLVLLHGFPLDGTIWAAQVDALAADVRVIAPDLRGFGRSTSVTPFTLDTLADDVHALLRHLGIDRAVVAGLSMGGYVLQAYARLFPQTLAGVAFVDTKADADTAEGKAGRNKMIDQAGKEGPRAVAAAMLPKMLAPARLKSDAALVHRVTAMMEACPALTIKHACAAMRDRPDANALLERLNVPAAVIVGDADAIIPVTLAEAMAGKLPRGSLHVIKGAGHLAPIEAPEPVTAALLELVARVH
ncbi:MAG TPA: alpha/beta hydrolase [Tepidisphaeraceae bacterium]|nr:alpha/beta hydrolase [Tepidisphaeraceae bacterium]